MNIYAKKDSAGSKSEEPVYNQQKSTPNINIHSDIGHDGLSDKNNYDNSSSGGYSPIGNTSLHSTSPGDNAAVSQQKPRTLREDNLLNLDDSSSNDEFMTNYNQTPSQQQQQKQPNQAPTKPTNLESDFGLLLDLGDTNTSENNKSDLEDLLSGGSFVPTPTGTTTVTPTNNAPTNSNNIFDPFGTFDVPLASGVKPTPMQTAQRPLSTPQGLG